MKLSKAVSRSITAENVYGEKGKGGMADLTEAPLPEVERIGQKWDGPNQCARDLGSPWKVRPCITLRSAVTTLMDVSASGIIPTYLVYGGSQSMARLDPADLLGWRRDAFHESPLGDFFCCGWKVPTKIQALPINVNPSGGFNCYFPMPFRKHAQITIENRAPQPVQGFFYAINFSETEIEPDDAYFHAQFRRTNPLPYMEDYTILDGVKGSGHFAGVYMAWQQNSTGWWGEGEFKAFIDGDSEYPTICGTGTEDYFGGAWGFGDTYSSPYLGYPYGNVDGKTGNRHGLYRFHIQDPIRFQSDLRIIMQAIGWRSEGRYLPLQDDISSVAYWYQSEPHMPFPQLGDRDALEVI